MNHTPIGRSFYSLTAFGALFVASGAISLVTSAQQSSPSPTQAKKAAQAVPPSTTTGKPVALPGFDNAHNAQSGAPAAAGDPQKQASLSLKAMDGLAKTSIVKGTDLVYTEGDMKFTGMTGVYNDDTKQFDAQGSLVLDDPKHHVTGDTSHVDRKKQLATIKGNVIITLKPTPSDSSVPANPDREKQRQYPVIITCDRADDSYKKEFIVLTGHLIFKQTVAKDNGKMVERTLTAEHGEYDGKANKLHLFEPVKSYDSEDQKGEFETDVFVGTKEGEETLATPGRATFRFNADDTADDDAATADKLSKDKQAGEKKPPEKKDTPPAPKQPN